MLNIVKVCSGSALSTEIVIALLGSVTNAPRAPLLLLALWRSDALKPSSKNSINNFRINVNSLIPLEASGAGTGVFIWVIHQDLEARSKYLGDPGILLHKTLISHEQIPSPRQLGDGGYETVYYALHGVEGDLRGFCNDVLKAFNSTCTQVSCDIIISIN
ncbi:uncharacterized protein LOC132636115 [Lycium barbarum]|uniref:uncharacterized protein LOC132636115 n=1 Tax=Lycium barbarum TaxID=112863 RepID=UPI00293EB14F|nr:uncharacterized protein LOC132636115 [Lycium barbarum]